MRKNVEADQAVPDHSHLMITQSEASIVRHVKQFDPRRFYQLQSAPGISKVLALVILYEVGDMDHFPTVQSFYSCVRLVKRPKESASKLYGYGAGKIDNAHLKQAFS